MIKKRIYFAVIALVGFIPASFAAVKIDNAAPDFSLVNTKGQQVSLSDYQGKYVVLEWTNHLCPYVKKHYESDNMQALQRKYNEKDIVWLSIISSAPGKQGYVDPAMAEKLTQTRNAASTHVLFDPEGDVGKLYDAKTTPHMYIISPSGELKYAGGIDSIKSAKQSDIPKAVNYVDASFDALMAGKPIDKKLTPPYGCSVKYKS